MASSTRRGLRSVLIVIACVLALAAVRSTNPVAELVGAIVLVLLAGWLLVLLFRARDRVVG